MPGLRADVFTYALTTAADPVKPGQLIEFELTVVNTSPDAQTLNFSFNVPENTTYGNNAAGTYENQQFFKLGTATLAIAVKEAIPVITSSLNPPSRQGVAFAYQITATNNPASYSASGLPTGLGLSTSTGKISARRRSMEPSA